VSATYPWTDESRRSENEQVALWELKLEELKLRPNDADLDNLSLGLRNFGYRKEREGHNPEVDRVYRAIQDVVLSIPGHAEYFSSEIETARKTLGTLTYEVSYERKRTWLFETLSHLPSPETIKILGHYLNDDRDLADAPKWTSDGILMGLNPNSRLALNTLENIGLRDPGFSTPEVGEWPDAKNYATREEAKRAAWNYIDTKRKTEIEPWREWYAELTSGQRTFSFKGQAVEYRFKPDGTWETIPIANPPDDAPKTSEPVPEPSDAKRQEKGRPATGTDDGQYPWPWIGLGIAVLSLVFGFFKMRK